MVSADNLNLDVLEVIFAYLFGRDLATVALVSRSFLSGVIPRLYGTIVYGVNQHKRYPKLMSPFASILSHPELAVHVRYVDIRSIPDLRGKPHPVFQRECIDVLTICRNLCTFKATDLELAPFLLCIRDKPRLHSLFINANLTPHQAEKVSQITGLRCLALERGSWQLLDVLPRWINSLQNTLTELTIHMALGLNECVLKAVLQLLPNLRGLHVIGCPCIDHSTIIPLLKYVPVLESLALSTSDVLSPPNTPVKLTHLRHLALDVRCSPAPSPMVAILSSVLLQIQSSYPPLTSFVFRPSDRAVDIPSAFVDTFARSHGATLTRFALVQCNISDEALTVLCKECIHLERLEIPIPIKDILAVPFMRGIKSNPFVAALANSSSLRMLIDKGDNHATHGPRHALTSDTARYLMSMVRNLRTIVSNGRIWTGTTKDGDLTLSLQRRKPSLRVNEWFLPRSTIQPADRLNPTAELGIF